MSYNPAYKNTKVLIAYHSHCIDGFTAAWATWYQLLQKGYSSTNISSMPVSYNQEPRAITNHVRKHKFGKVYIVDFSYDREVLAKLGRLCPSVVMLDHHKKAFNLLLGDSYEVQEDSIEAIDDIPNVSVLLDMNECGASLVWKSFTAGSTHDMPSLIQYVKDYDLWRFEYRAAKGINKYLRIQDKNFNVWSLLYHTFEDNKQMEDILTTSSSLQKYHKSIVAGILEYCTHAITIDGNRGLVCNCGPEFSSDVGHKLATRSGTFGATWNEDKHGNVKFSLRSNGDYDVDLMARAFGGGGHRNAAGFQTTAPAYDEKRGMTVWSNYVSKKQDEFTEGEEK